MTDERPPITTFVVTDIEADGPNPLESSMLSFASVACDVTGKVLGEFEAVLAPRADRKASPDTMAWWATQPEAWKARDRRRRGARGGDAALCRLGRGAAGLSRVRGGADDLRWVVDGPLSLDLRRHPRPRRAVQDAADFPRRRGLPLHHGRHAARRRVSQVGHAARAARVVRQHRPHATRRSTTRAALPMCSAKLFAISGALPKIEATESVYR